MVQALPASVQQELLLFAVGRQGYISALSHTGRYLYTIKDRKISLHYQIHGDISALSQTGGYLCNIIHRGMPLLYHRLSKSNLFCRDKQAGLTNLRTEI